MFFEMVTGSKLALKVQIYNSFSAKPVNSEEEARIIGEHIAHKLYDGTDLVDFSKYEETPRIDDNGDTYAVFYSLPPVKYTLPDYVPVPKGEFREKWVTPLGGGGPTIMIDKATGKILD